MPIVTIQITREGTTPGQKAALIRGATDLLRDVLDKPPGLTFVLSRKWIWRTGVWTAFPRPSTGAGLRPRHLGSSSANLVVFRQM